ncbi:MAG: hypothetical protein OEY19_01015, partial [Gammaproteobacteria bacterium]|nr:hypothetical protein [Gammaproteobacteria bacterium]
MISFLKLIAFISDGLYDRVTSNSHQIVKKVFSSLALIFLVFVALFFTSFKLLAACSPYTGYATINEAGRVGYVEIKLLDSRIDPAIYQSWTVSVCEGQRNRCSGDLPLTGLTPTNTSFILVYTDLIPSNRPFDIILKDADGNTIDYFSVDYTPQQDTSCSLPFPWSSNVENTHVYLRYPDGTGIWSIPGKGNSGVKTGGAANTPWLPDLSVVNITVAKGDPATFVFTIPAAETVDITFDYSTVDNTALAGTHYTAASGTVTIPAGSTSGSVSIATTAGSPDGTVVFDMFLSNPVNANIISNYISATLINAGPSAIKILHDGSGINCLAEAVTVRLLNNTGGLFTGFTGAINLSTSTGNGDWSLLTGSGVLTTGAADSGSATYTFNLTDGGEVVFQLSDTHQESVNIAVTDGNIFDDDTEGLLTFRPFGFVFSPDPISTQIAGRPFNLTLTAAGQTPAQPECGVIEEYTGVQSLNFWGSYVSPATSPTAIQVDGINVAASQAGSAAQNVNFTNGVGNVSVLYNDVGQISLSAQDQFNIGEPVAGTTDEIIGGITPFVVRPFGYDIQINTNPYANDGNDPVFASAGQAFNMTIRSVLWQAADDLNNDGIPDPFIDTNNDAVPDSGGNLSD